MPPNLSPMYTGEIGLRIAVMTGHSKHSKFMSAEEYLRAEQKTKIRHEYVDGYIYAMTGTTVPHNVICTNIVGFLNRELRSSGCRAYQESIKVRVDSLNSFYYPDILVSCEPFDSKSVFLDKPILIMEVLSPSTAHIDRREKRLAYQMIPSLVEYAVVHQNRQLVELFRREAEKFELTHFTEGKLILQSLPVGHLELPLSAIYEDWNPPMRVKETEVEYDPDYPHLGSLLDPILY
jgi:Uma2 family endonuclease